MEQSEPIGAKQITQHDTDLIREIYQLTHDAKIMNSQELQLRLTELIAEAEKRKLM